MRIENLGTWSGFHYFFPPIWAASRQGTRHQATGGRGDKWDLFSANVGILTLGPAIRNTGNELHFRFFPLSDTLQT